MNVIFFTGNYGEVVKYVSKSTEVLAKNVAHLDTVLATLEPQAVSLGVMAVLCVRLQNTTHTDANIDTLHATVAEFINVCSEEQIKYAPDMSKSDWHRLVIVVNISEDAFIVYFPQ